jgi:hypothetical protein
MEPAVSKPLHVSRREGIIDSLLDLGGLLGYVVERALGKLRPARRERAGKSGGHEHGRHQGDKE